MGIFDFFRKKTSPESKEQESKNLDNSLSRKKKSLLEKESEEIAFLEKSIKSLVESLNQSLIEIRKIDINERKVEEKFKQVVQNNLDRYLMHLENLSKSLEGLQFRKLSDLILKSNYILQDFEKKSFMNFEKATILIGKELGQVVECIKDFYKDLKEVKNRNQVLIQNLSDIEKIEETLSELSRKNLLAKSQGKELESSQEEIQKLEKLLKNLNQRIPEISSGKSHHEFQKRKRVKEEKILTFNSEISRLKNLIDLKELIKTYHTNEKKMKTLKEYRENFSRAFESDRGKIFLEISQNSEVSKQISKINSLEEEIAKIEVGKDEILEVEKEISEIKLKIRELEEESQRKEKKISQTEEEISEIKSKLENQASSIGVKISV